MFSPVASVIASIGDGFGKATNLETSPHWFYDSEKLSQYWHVSLAVCVLYDVQKSAWYAVMVRLFLEPGYINYSAL